MKAALGFRRWQWAWHPSGLAHRRAMPFFVHQPNESPSCNSKYGAAAQLDRLERGGGTWNVALLLDLLRANKNKTKQTLIFLEIFRPRQDSVVVRYHPVFLNPNVPKAGNSKMWASLWRSPGLHWHGHCQVRSWGNMGYQWLSTISLWITM